MLENSQNKLNSCVITVKFYFSTACICDLHALLIKNVIKEITLRILCVNFVLGVQNL